jgi:hypothetical protein
MYRSFMPVGLGPSERLRLAIGVHIVRLIDGPWIGFILGFVAGECGPKCHDKITSIFDWR